MIGEILCELRKDAGLTQDELAAILHINKHSISSYERNKSEPPDAVKIEIAKYFCVSTDYLLGLSKNTGIPGAECNMLRLPKQFPEEAKKSLKDYAEYLAYKYKK